ncbi:MULTISPECIES: M48 family metallopeptidase [Rufibacter]|uniref:Putative Zn-dependent protease n=1 Tax=Rufibacter quisquiliarum TaxID=1549639 RepID=A0A839GM14_9BACT|nr:MULTISPECIES: M48 family metallopeptidase [Rufibacter]MBA9079760.1 putative Zn-dependent protease [Rufibacter quisquiliarum]
MNMFKNAFLTLTLLVMLGCSTVPITGRRQVSLVSDQEVITMSFQAYNDLLKQSRLSNNASQTAMVKRVGQKIQRAVEQFMQQQGASSQLEGYQWEFNLIEDAQQQNAFAMAGGKTAVYTGLLPITKDESGLAVVMGHEIAHAIAKHSNERISQQLLAEYGGATLGAVLGQNPGASSEIVNAAYGIGAQGVLLKWGRTQESEADRLGLIFMAMAGYNPQTAVTFWQRMAAASGGASQPELLSTHPSNETRIADIQKHLPEAQKYYTGR